MGLRAGSGGPGAHAPAGDRASGALPRGRRRLRTRQGPPDAHAVQAGLGADPLRLAGLRRGRAHVTSATRALTDDTFDAAVLASGRPVLVDFWAQGCAQCRLLAPVLDEIASECRDRLDVGTIDLGSNPETGRRYGITSVPTLLLFVDGEPVRRIAGARPKRALLHELAIGLGGG
ncbi:MAG: thioredoxin fold domain-containing protein [Streptosporangiales bacterium]|nr:thioredoxin fold domain-containing protein [Streptosporangiales bacterium]